MIETAAKSQMRILLIDNDEKFGLLISDLLSDLGEESGEGIILDRLSDFDQALQVIARKRHEICLVNYELGDFTGLDLLARVIAKGCSTPVILVTEAYAREVDMAAIRTGAADYLIKAELNAPLLERSIRYALDRKRAEEALRLSEESLSRAQRIAHVGNWDWNIQTDEMFWSDETYRILGFYPRDTPAKYEFFLRAVHTDDRNIVNRAVNEAIYLQKELNIDYRIIPPHGVEHIVHHQGEIVLDSEGNPLRLVGTLQDVTQWRRVEDALRQMEEKFSKAFHASPDWVVMSSASDGRYLEVNEAFLQLTGYSREEVVGKTSVELGVWVDPAERTRMLKLLDEHGVVRNLEVNFRMKSGDICCMLWSAEVIDYKGEACLIAVARDVTEQRELEKELVKSQAELFNKHAELTKVFQLVEAGKREWEMTMDQVGDMVILADENGKIRRCNRAFREFTGVPYEQLIGADWVELLHKRELITGTIFLESMELYHQPSGRWYVLNPYPFSQEELPELSGTVITIHDTTELKRYGDQIASMNNELQQAYHELKSFQEMKG